MELPQIFTPNGDGYNDNWNITSDKEIKIEIYDRFGKVLKVLKNNETWNGTFKQQLLPASDYWFVIYYNAKVFRSHFSLKR
ncbi:T9SS type B sorting domain-containing protein [Flavobacterium sp.]|uniref:T9SS type B sorting domain-containing protein n=1 Tax=Flavobacterium sp. TaxID=239 RepID=UPI003752DB67